MEKLLLEEVDINSVTVILSDGLCVFCYRLGFMWQSSLNSSGLTLVNFFGCREVDYLGEVVIVLNFPEILHNLVLLYS